MILATGHGKGRAVQQAVEGAYNHAWTITALQAHPRGILVVDDPAATRLRVATYRYFKDMEKYDML
jgi:glucosamine-6-phosphate deaminase